MIMEHTTLAAIALLLADLAIRIGLSLRIIMRRLPVGTTLAWLSVVLVMPFAGALVYLLIGELRLGTRRVRHAAVIHRPYSAWLKGLRDRYPVDEVRLPVESQSLERLTEAAAGIPVLPGNHLELLTAADDILRRLIEDIDAARARVRLEFYIWHVGGLADDVVQALVRAAQRGVDCRVLLDSVGSRPFFATPQYQAMRDAGVQLRVALPVGLVRMLFVRFDLRLHRKIVVIDERIAYTGSLNLVDPRYFKQDAGVGQWVDAMVRLRGPAVEALGVTFLEDWELETDEGLATGQSAEQLSGQPLIGTSDVQVVPSGPLLRQHAIREVLLMAIYSARRELILTTPYFVPDESLLTALISAANRGVNVTLIVPARVDSLLVRLASRAYVDDLVSAGVRIYQFHDGLLHTKSITVDGQFSLFGSLNLDPRSLMLNFEITLAVYDPEFTNELRGLQHDYRDRSAQVQLDVLRRQSYRERLTNNIARLVSPLL